MNDSPTRRLRGRRRLHLPDLRAVHDVGVDGFAHSGVELGHYRAVCIYLLGKLIDGMRRPSENIQTVTDDILSLCEDIENDTAYK